MCRTPVSFRFLALRLTDHSPMTSEGLVRLSIDEPFPFQVYWARSLEYVAVQLDVDSTPIETTLTLGAGESKAPSANEVAKIEVTQTITQIVHALRIVILNAQNPTLSTVPAINPHLCS